MTRSAASVVDGVAVKGANSKSKMLAMLPQTIPRKKKSSFSVLHKGLWDAGRQS
jgi:hypothetical protein